MSFDLVITDYKMPRISGLDLIRHIRENYKYTEVLMMTGYPSVEVAVDAMKSGAEDYISKPFSIESLLKIVKKAISKQKSRMIGDSEAQSFDPVQYGMICSSEPMMKIIRNIETASATMATILINGESGTGKELIARAVHYNSNRSCCSFCSN